MWKPTTASLQCDLDYDLASISNFPQSCSTRVLLSALNGLCGDTEKMLTYPHTHTLTHTFTLSLRRIAFLQTTHLMSLSLSVLLPWQQLNVQRYSCAEQILLKNSLFLLTVHKAIDCALWPPLTASVTHCYVRAELRLCGILAKHTSAQRRLTVSYIFITITTKLYIFIRIKY